MNFKKAPKQAKTISLLKIKKQPYGYLRQLKVLISPADNEGESGENKTEQGYFRVTVFISLKSYFY